MMTAGQKLFYILDEYTNIFKFIEQRRTRWFINNFPITKWINSQCSILDIGSGVGDITKEMVEITKSNNVIGIDFADYRMKEIKIMDYYSFILADAHNIPIISQSLDCVTIFWVLHHVNNPDVVLNEAIRVLKKNGILIIIEDVVDSNIRYKKLIYKFYDMIVNLDFNFSMYNNRSIMDWIKSVDKIYPMKLEEFIRIPIFKHYDIFSFVALKYRK